MDTRTPEYPSALDLLIERGLACTEERVGYVDPWAYSLLMLALQHLIRRPAENLGLALQLVTATPASWVTLQNALARVGGRQPLSAATRMGVVQQESSSARDGEVSLHCPRLAFHPVLGIRREPLGVRGLARRDREAPAVVAACH
jgi:hypothetical protein